MQIDQPEEGYYKTRLVKDGPFVPAIIYMEPFTKKLICEVNGEEKDPVEQWIYLGGNRIEADEYNFMMADALHAEEHRPHDAKADPTRAVDIGHNLPPAEAILAAQGILEEAKGISASFDAIEEAHAGVLMVKRLKITGEKLEDGRKEVEAPIKETLAEAKAPWHEVFVSVEEMRQDLLRRLDVFRKVEDIEEIATDYGPKAFLRKTQTVTVISAEKVPAEYCSPDMKKIKAAIKEGEDVPGVLVENDQVITVS